MSSYFFETASTTLVSGFSSIKFLRPGSPINISPYCPRIPIQTFLYGGALFGTAPHVYAQGDTPILERGLGFNIAVTDGTGDGGWEAETYEFYQSFVYESNQESLPFLYLQM